MKYDEEFIVEVQKIKKYNNLTERGIKWLGVLALELKNIANELSEIREIWENK
jgi:hypothetical protein